MKTLCIVALTLSLLTLGALPSPSAAIPLPNGCELYANKPRKRNKRGRR